MSLYNMLHGMNPASPILKAVLGLDCVEGPAWPKNEKGEDYYCYDEGRGPLIEKYVEDSISMKAWPTGRFRDIHLNEDGSRIVLYTRNGGGNRDEYFYVFDILRKHPNYKTDYDDDFDSTYAYIEFSIPKEAEALCKALTTGDKPKTIHEMFTETISQMEKMKPSDLKKDKRFAPIVEMLEKVVQEVKK